MLLRSSSAPWPSNYRTSAVHAAGEDLAQLVAAAALARARAGAGRRQRRRAHGAGHWRRARARRQPSICRRGDAGAGAALALERGLANLTFQVGDVEALTFADASFDLVASRYSAHHWPHPQRALAEFRRVLRPGGRVLISDIVSYDDFVTDTHLQAIELLRDPSHVRDHTPTQWLAMLAAANFTPVIRFMWALRLDFTAWVDAHGDAGGDRGAVAHACSPTRRPRCAHAAAGRGGLLVYAARALIEGGEERFSVTIAPHAKARSRGEDGLRAISNRILSKFVIPRERWNIGD